MSLRLPFFPTLLVGAAAITMIVLGIWQLQRAEWKDGLIASYEAARGKEAIAFPDLPVEGEGPLFRSAYGTCSTVTGWRQVAGESANGAVGYAFLADCPEMTVDAGWSPNPQLKPDWSGGEVRGVIAPDRNRKIRLVSAEGLGGLDTSAVPSTENVPDNHMAYAIQWFIFAALSLIIYGFALRGRMAKGSAA